MSSERGARHRLAIAKISQEIVVLLELLEDVTLPDFEVERVEFEVTELLAQLEAITWRGVNNGRVMRGERP